MSNDILPIVCVCIITLCFVVVTLVIILQSFEESKTKKELYDKGYEDAKNLYFNHWRKEFETARLKLIDTECKFGNHYVTMYLKRRDYE